MSAFFYTRAENKTAARQAFARMKAAWKSDTAQIISTEWDALSGQRGLMAMLRWTYRPAEDDECKTVVVDSLSDLGRDVPGLVKQISALLSAGVSVYSAATNLFFSSQLNDKEAQVINALAEAHVRYTSENRKRGMASAREAGATIGKPPNPMFTLDAVRETLVRLTDAADGTLPSVRDLAKAVGCGNTKASELLRDYLRENGVSNSRREGEEPDEAAENQEAEAEEQK